MVSSQLELARLLDLSSVSKRFRQLIEAAVNTGEVAWRPGRGTSKALCLTSGFGRDAGRDENTVAAPSRLDDQVTELDETRRGFVASTSRLDVSAGQSVGRTRRESTPYGGDLSALDEPPTDTPPAVASDDSPTDDDWTRYMR
jgi:hypothetical protein